MKLEFHPAVRQDFIQARDFYQTKGGPHLADRFEQEFQACFVGYSRSTKSVLVLLRQ
jgi:plasmid stabilization system protein ParE